MKGIIYLLSNSVDDRIYIGSTFQKLNIRMGGHRSNARAHIRNSDLYIHMRKIGISKWIIEAIKIRKVKSKAALERIEFRCMAMYSKERLLNMNTVYGEKSAEHVRKVSRALRGDKSYRFQRGSIMKLERMKDGYIDDMITFRWLIWENDVSKQRSKSFSIKKYGERNAMKMAEAFRDEIYPPTK